MLKRVYTQGTISLRITLGNDTNLKKYHIPAFGLSPVYVSFASFGTIKNNKHAWVRYKLPFYRGFSVKGMLLPFRLAYMGISPIYKYTIIIDLPGFKFDKI